MRPLILFLFLFVLSVALVGVHVIYSSPVDDNQQLIPAILGLFLVGAFGATFGLMTGVFFLFHRLYERILRKKQFSDQKLQLRRYWRSSIRRGALSALLVSALLGFRGFGIDNQLNVALLVSIVVLTEVLVWRYYTR